VLSRKSLQNGWLSIFGEVEPRSPLSGSRRRLTILREPRSGPAARGVGQILDKEVADAMTAGLGNLRLP
jgi:hypothetical protein